MFNHTKVIIPNDGCQGEGGGINVQVQVKVEVEVPGTKLQFPVCSAWQ